jgi:hypothetical protein
MEKPVFFTEKSLARFVSAHGKTVEKVICHLWYNAVDSNNKIEIIDNVELVFTDHNKLTIGCSDEGNALEAINFDYKEASKQIAEEFGGKIRLFAIDASTTKMWEDVTGSVLRQVRVTKEGDLYRADSVMLDFGDEKREISIAPLDGIIIDYYEED